jgi:protein-S-isoprenylcysteine O-methyltransferase Ste14
MTSEGEQPTSAPPPAPVQPLLARIIRSFDSNPVLFHALNVAVAGVWVYRGSVSVGRLHTEPGWSVLGLVKTQPADVLNLMMFSLLVVFYLLRRRTKDVATDAVSLVLAHLGTWGSLFFEGADVRYPAIQEYCIWVMVGALAVALLGFVSLGRSWGILPANRGVKTGLLYRLVRHPIYASYIVFYASFTLLEPSITNGALFVGLALVLYARARLEEKVLMGDPLYAAYARRTRYMLFPFVV